MAIDVGGARLAGTGRLPSGADKSYQYLILRLLLGTVRLERGNIHTRQDFNFSIFPAKKQSASPARAVDEYLKTYSLGGSVARLIKVTASDNREYFRELLCEFSNYFLQESQGRSTSAFIFLYRAFEKSLFSIPLLYASTQRDFQGTFRQLKGLFNEDGEGELGLFKTFLRDGRFIDKLILQAPYTITFSNVGGNAQQYFKVSTTRFKNFVSSDPTRNEVEIKFEDLPDFLTTIRNRFFHFKTGEGRNNISTLEMVDSDEYFSSINPVIASFVAVLTLQTIATKYRV